MAKLDSRGAKIYLKSVEDFTSKEYPAFESFIRKLINWTDSTKPFESIASTGRLFEQNLPGDQVSRLVGASTLNSHCVDGELTQKSLATIICYIFYEYIDQKIIREKLEQLFAAIRCGEGSSYYEWINTIIKENIEIKIKADDEKEGAFNMLENEGQLSESFKRTFDKYWSFSIDKNWNPVSAKNSSWKILTEDRYVKIPEIISVLNNERELNGKKRSWWERRRTLFAYITGLLFGWTWLGMSLIAIGFYKTRKQVIDRRVKRIRYAIFSFALLITAGVITWGIVRNQTLTQELFENAKITLPAQYDTDPYRNGFGFVTIHDGTQPNPQPFECEYIELPDLHPGEEYPIKLFILYANSGRLIMTDAGVRVFYSNIKKDSSSVFSASLSASNASEVHDAATILNMKEEYNIYFDDGLNFNRHGRNDPQNCLGHDFILKVESHIFTQNIYALGNLENSYCSAGVIQLNFVIRNDTFLFYPEEKGIFNYKDRIQFEELKDFVEIVNEVN